MRTRILTLLPTALLVAVLGACGEDEPGTASGGGGVDSDPAAAELTEDWDCGFGLARSDEEQASMLRIFHNGERRIARSVALPDPAWDAELLVGTHLAANWCTDVIEQPEAEVEETWTVVDGTLMFDGAVPPATWDGTASTDEPVEATLIGVVVEGPDGERVELGDVPLRNRSWGFLAG